MLPLLLLSLATVVITGPQTIHAIGTADLNHDGYIDIVTQDSYGYTIHLNRKELRFEASQRIERIGIGEPGGLALADINHDTHIDLISGSHDSYRIAVLLGDGKGTFTPAQGSPFSPNRHGKPHNHRVAVADLNGDKHPDIVAANIVDGDLSIFLGDGRSGFAPSSQSPLPMGPGAYAIRIADINHDGSPDLVVASTHDEGPDLQVALSRGNGTFERIETGASRKKLRIANLDLVDWNRDGHLDAIVGPGDEDRPQLLIGNGKGGFVKSDAKVPGAPPNVRLFAQEDFDRDGKPDLLTVVRETGTIQINKIP